MCRQRVQHGFKSCPPPERTQQLQLTLVVGPGPRCCIAVLPISLHFTLRLASKDGDMTSAYPAVVQEGDTIIWDINGDRQALITVEKNTCAGRYGRRKTWGARVCRNQLCNMLSSYCTTESHLGRLLKGTPFAIQHQCNPSRSKVKLGKVFCSAAALLGCPYGSMFALSADGKSLERTE